MHSASAQLHLTLNHKHTYEQQTHATGNGQSHAHTSTERDLKARIILQGASGSGKSYSALLLAYGLCKDYSKVAVIETGYRASVHYRYLGPFHIVPIQAPYSSEKFLDALEQCTKAGLEVVILDTLSAEWIGAGGVVDRLRNQEDCMHYHEALIEAIQHSPAHIIATLQTTEEYVLTNVKGRPAVEKVGLAPLQGPGIHYHFDTVLALDCIHKAKCLKDRTSFFEEHSGTIITEELASLFPSWLTQQPTPSALKRVID